VKKSVSPAKPVKAGQPPATPAKPVAAARKPLSLKSLFSRKSAPKPAPDPAPKPVAAVPKKSPPPKTTRGPVMRRDPGEFLDISFPAPKNKKASVASATATRR